MCISCDSHANANATHQGQWDWDCPHWDWQILDPALGKCRDVLGDDEFECSMFDKKGRNAYYVDDFNDINDEMWYYKDTPCVEYAVEKVDGKVPRARIRATSRMLAVEK